MPKTTKEPIPPEQKLIQPRAGHRCVGESDKACSACNDYLQMGRKRSLRRLTELYTQEYDEVRQSTVDIDAPTTSYDTLAVWSARFDWSDRAHLYDFEMEQKRGEIAEAVMNSRLSLPHIRMQFINDVFTLLYDELWEAEEISGDEKDANTAEGETVLRKLWLKDYKNVGGGETPDIRVTRRYNSALIADIRALLDDAAKETGGRRPKDEGQALLDLLVHKVGLQNLPDEVIDRTVKGENPYVVIFDIINNINVPTGSTPAGRGSSRRGSK